MKPLEALEDIKQCLFWSEKGIQKIEIIENALKDYEKQHQIDVDLLGTAYKTNVQNQNKLKALEIIKNIHIQVVGRVIMLLNIGK